MTVGLRRRICGAFTVGVLACGLGFAAAAVHAQTGETGLKWQPLYEPGSGGWMTGIQVSPHDGRRVLLGGDMLGIGLSEDAGETWQSAFGLKSWEIGDFTWHPTKPNIVWAGTMSGPYVSMDGGRNWQEKRKGMPPPAGFGYSVPIEKVLFDPNNPIHLLAIGGSRRGWESGGAPAWGAIWESKDGGEDWTKISTITAQGSSNEPNAKGVNIQSAAFAANSSTRLFAGAAGVGVLVSEDGGKTWEIRNGDLKNRNVQTVVAHPKDKNTLFISLESEKRQGAELATPGGVYKSADAGKTWISLNNGLSQTAAKETYFSASYKGFAVAPSNPDVMAADDGAWNTGVLYVTHDGGRSWTATATKQNVGNDNNDPARQSLVHVETAYFAGVSQTTITFDPHDTNVIYSGGAEYGLVSRDGGKTWKDNTSYHPKGATGWRGRGFSGLVTTNFAFHPADKNRAVFQALDAGKLWLSADGMKSWTHKMATPAPWYGSYDVTFAGKNVYATFGQFGQFYGIGRSTDNGDNFTLLGGQAHGLPEVEARGQQATGIHAQPDAPNRVWACIEKRLYHSEDSGEHWTTIAKIGPVQYFAQDIKNPKRFYVSGERNVYVTEDGLTFTSLGGPHQAGRMTVDALNRLYVAADQGERGGLWRYDGTNWTRLLDERWITNVTVDPTNPERIAVCTNQNPYAEISQATGVWISADGGKTWSQQNANLPMLRGFALAINPHDPEQMVFGTDGRGFFVTRWPKTFAPVGSRSYKNTDEDVKFAAVRLSGSGPMITVKNGDMKEGGDAPKEWGIGWIGKGKLKATRDTKVFKSGPASLLLASDGGAALGQAAQTVDGAGGTKFILSGSMKTAGSAKVNFAVQSYTSSWTPISFQQVGYLQNDADWNVFSKEITLPDGTAHVGIVLLLDGEGKAWLDDVKISGVKLPDAQP